MGSKRIYVIIIDTIYIIVNVFFGAFHYRPAIMQPNIKRNIRISYNSGHKNDWIPHKYNKSHIG